MKTKIIVFILLISTVSVGSYYYYRYNYVQTLKLSEIVGTTDDSLTNLAVSLMDFDTGLTRNDLNKIKSSKEYWIKRLQDVEIIQNPELKAQEYEKILKDLMDDPTMSKIVKGTFAKTSEFLVMILNKL
jgi:hypothetical protein